jgi:hypothetical protein
MSLTATYLVVQGLTLDRVDMQSARKMGAVEAELAEERIVFR